MALMLRRSCLAWSDRISNNWLRVFPSGWICPKAWFGSKAGITFHVKHSSKWIPSWLCCMGLSRDTQDLLYFRLNPPAWVHLPLLPLHYAQTFAKSWQLRLCPSRKPGHVLDLWNWNQIAQPNSKRLMNSPITRSCITTVLEKQIVLRANRLMRVRKVKCLRSIFWVLRLPTVCSAGLRCRS